MFIHELPDDSVGIHDDQIPERHGPDQHSLRVQDIADVDGLGVEADLADPVDRVADRHILFEVDILDRHDTARRILRIAEQVIDVLAGLGLRVL